MALINTQTKADDAVATLHYIFDPLCGWCYAVAPLVEAARQVAGLKIELHGGGMMTAANGRRKMITPEWREYVKPNDLRIAQLSGQTFGDAYHDILLNDMTAILDSEPPTIAILAAESIAERGLDMLHRLQQAHYLEGRRIADFSVLDDIAIEMGLDVHLFKAAMQVQTGLAIQQHFGKSHALLNRIGGGGFPTFILGHANRQIQRLDSTIWLGRPEAWQAHLEQMIKHGSD